MRFFAPILEVLPPHPKLRMAAGLLLALAPIALIVGLLLRWTHPEPAPLAVQYDRAGWVNLANASARRFGVDASGWNASVQVDQNENAVRHDARASSESNLRERLNPPVTVSVQLQEPGGGRRFEAKFGASGDLLRWSIHQSDEGHKIPPDTSRELATAAASEWLKPYGPVTFSDWRTRSEQDDVAAGWEAHARFAAAPRERYRVNLGIGSNTVTSASITDENEAYGDTALGDFEQFVKFCGFSLTCFFLIYSLRLFRRRRREGEIPRERAWVLIGIFGVCGGLFVVLNPESVDNSSSTIISIGLTLLKGLGTSILFALGGLFVSAAYASGEGEIREGWPGKLISFDALLAGKWSARAVGISAVLACTVAAWAFFLSACAWRLAPVEASLLIDKDLLELAAGRNVLIRSLVDFPLRVSFLIVAGLFMPLAFVHRRRWTGWKLWTVLLVSPFFVDAAFRAFSMSGIGPLVTSIGMVAALVVPFYYGDVLASVLGALLYASLISASALATEVPAIAPVEALLLLLMLAGLLSLAVSAWRGVEVDESAVRPRYARNIEERLSLQAEVSAAREAQLRLLPAALPQHDGLSVAAYCQPAGVVGGDFFDFFPAPDGRLGVFVASGSGMGLASALTIALAKGFLSSEVRRGEDPATSLQSLLRALSGRVGAAADETGLLVALVDSSRGEVRMARRGRYPSAWLMRGKEFVPAGFDGKPDGGVEVGVLEWRPGDLLVLCTEGFASLLDDQSVTGQRSWLNATARRRTGADANEIQHHLMQRLGGRRGKRLRKLRRDLTTVVLRNQAA